MKHFFLIYIPLLGFATGLHAQSPTQSRNFIMVETPLVPTTQLSDVPTLNVAEKSAQIVYFDGLGREIQSVDWRANPGMRDLVKHTEYDAFGRVAKEFLPYQAMQVNAAYISNAASATQSFYDTQFGIATPAAADKLFDGSPLNEVREQGNVGAAWQIFDNQGSLLATRHSIQSDIQVFDASIAIPKCYWDVATHTFGYNGFYAAGDLLVSKNTDENGHITYSYKDKAGRNILTRTQADNTGNYACTMYLYDDFGRVAAVLQPEGFAALATANGQISPMIAEQYLFQYRYDERGRVVAKKVPSSEWVYMVYDKLDRVVLSQDGNLAANSDWLFTKYDVYGRAILTGKYLNPQNLTQAQLSDMLKGNAATVYPLFENRVAQNSSYPEGYSNQAFPPLSDCELHSATWYDDYDFNNDGSPDYSYIPQGNFPNNVVSYHTKGKVAGVKTRILNPDPDMPEWLLTVSFYDKYGRVLQTFADNHLGGQDMTTSEYDFSGKVLKTETHHRAQEYVPSLQTSGYVWMDNTVKKRYKYDHRGRVMRVLQQNNEENEIVLIDNQYDAMGKLIEKNLHSTDNGAHFLQSIDYKYNIRSWLTHINRIDYNASVIGIDIDPAGELGDITGMNLRTVHVSLGTENRNGDLTHIAEITDDKDIIRQEGAATSIEEADTYIEEERTGAVAGLVDGVLTIDLGNVAVSKGAYTGIETAIDSQIRAAYVGQEVPETELQGLIDLVRNNLIRELDNVFESDDENDLFNEELRYEDPYTLQPTGGDAQYNGNISVQIWQTRSQQNRVRNYQYHYDAMNRLTAADYQAYASGVWGHALGRYNTPQVSYDLNGNILTMQRNGVTGFTANNTLTFGMTDDLSYLYNGNRLASVEDAIPVASFTDAEDFQNKASLPAEYGYDANGNITIDANSGYTIAYNHLNKPTQILELATNNVINMIYSTDGNKLRQTTYTNGQAAQVMDYSTGYIYKGRELQYFSHEEGRCLRTSTSTPDAATPNVHLFRYEYNLTDHLGNVRISFSDTDNDGKAEVLQEQHYEAYGLRLGGLVFQDGEENRFTYSGKERIGELGLGWSDFGARMYNPAIGRWNGVDALAEKYVGMNPYMYVAGNPIRLKDKDGREIIIDYVDASGNKQSMVYSYQKDRKLDKTTPEFLTKAIGALDELSEKSTTANGAIQELVNTSLKFTIQEGGESKFKPDKAGEPSGGVINWNNKSPVALKTQNGLNANAILDLGHELFHADNARVGKWKNPMSESNASKPVENGLSPEEASASAKENLMRAEMGEPLRATYNDDPDLPWDNKTFDDIAKGRYHFPIIDSNGKPIYDTKGNPIKK